MPCKQKAVLQLADGTLVESMEELYAKIEEEDGPDMLFLTQKMMSLFNNIPTQDAYDMIKNDFAAAFENEAIKCGADKLTVKEVFESGLFKEIGLKAIEDVRKITRKRAETLEYPLDTVNTKIWEFPEWDLVEKNKAGKAEIKAEKSGSKKQINILYSINFEELVNGITITKRLTAYDKRVYIACSGLYNAGNTITSLTQIHYIMGNTSTPGRSTRKNIRDSIDKMQSAKIYVTNEEEAKKYKYDKFIYGGALLPCEWVDGIISGKAVETAIHFFREPPLISFAKRRKQITTISARLLQSPISKTDENLRIEDYLIERIDRAKAGTQPNRILFKTLYERAQITPGKQQQRAPDKIEIYLKHYIECEMINRYTVETDGITFYTGGKGAPKYSFFVPKV